MLSKHKFHIRRHIIAEALGALGGGFFVGAFLQKSTIAGAQGTLFILAAVIIDIRNIESEEKEVEAAAETGSLSKEELTRLKEILGEWSTVKNTAETAYACAVGGLPTGGTAHKIACEVVTTGLTGMRVMKA